MSCYIGFVIVTFLYFCISSACSKSSSMTIDIHKGRSYRPWLFPIRGGQVEKRPIDS